MEIAKRIEAFIPDTDQEYLKHKDLWVICNRSGVSLPIETQEYFEGCDEPEDKLRIELKSMVHYMEYNNDMKDGYDVFIDKLPKGVTQIRFIIDYDG